MKTRIALFLTLALCLSLCACGVDEQYKPLLESLEAGSYDGIKTALSTLSADFAAEQNELEKYRKYEALISELENQNIEAALVEFEKALPTPPEPTYSVLEITLENWDTYFEFTDEENWHLNGFGESENYSHDYHLKVREEYLDKIKADGCDITVEVSYTAHYHNATVDLAAKEISIGEIVTNISGDEVGDVSVVSDIRYLNNNNLLARSIATYLIEWDTGEQSMYVIEDAPTVTRIQGTIQLMDE